MKKYLFFLGCLFFYTNAYCQPPCNLTADTTVCYPSGFPFYWHGEMIYEPGPASYSLQGADGYDTAYYCLYVYYEDDPKFYETDTICPSQLPYTWRGQIFTQGGYYQNIIPAPGLCDSIINFTLYVRPIPLITSFYPDSGSTGESISITGNDFDNVTAVYFGASPASSIVHITSHNILATVGSGASGPVAVASYCSTTSMGNFKFVSNPNNIGIGSPVAPSKLTVTGGDIYVHDVGSGLILKDVQGNCYRVIIGTDNFGYRGLQVIPITCP